MDVLAVEQTGGKTKVLTLPRGSVVRVANGSSAFDERMVEVVWQDKTVMVFGMDLTHRATRLQPATFAG
jgi:hypothetical protein